MKTPDEQLLGRWLDGELSAEERASFEAMMAADADLREQAESMKSLGEALRKHVTFEREVPHGDFFNSQIQEAIASEQRATERARDTSARASGSWLNWLRSPWMLAGAAAALAAGFYLLHWQDAAGPGSNRTQIVSYYVPNTSVTSTAYFNKDAGATVLMLDGLKPIPADTDVAGLNIHRSVNDPEHAITTLYDERGEVLLVMSKDMANRPQMSARTAIVAR